MVWLKKKHAGSAPGYQWGHDGDVVDVDEELALELLERPGDEFSEAPAPQEQGDEDEDTEDPAEGEGDGEGDQPAKKTTRRRTKVSE